MGHESILFLVRVWPAAGGFRAAVRPVDSERVETFTAADALARYFEGVPRLPASESAATGDDDPN